MRKKKYLCALGMSAFAFFSSNVLSAEGSVNWEAGAKRGWVVKIYDENTFENEVPGCVRKLSQTDRKNKLFVRVWYRHVRSGRVTIAEITGPMNLKMNDQVEIFPADCDEGKFAHIGKILTSKE